jgi:TonB family protein
MQASRLKTFAPAFPRDAIGSIGSGVVVLKAVIGTDGKVQGLNVLSGPETFVPAAEDAVRRWEYQPYLFMGEAVPVETQVTVKFEVGNKPLPADEMQWMLDHPQSMLTDVNIHEDSPLYPDAARQRGRHGRAVVVAKVDPDGTLSDFRVIRSDDFFRDAALGAAKQQKNVPLTAGEGPRQAQLTIFVNFVK